MVAHRRVPRARAAALALVLGLVLAGGTGALSANATVPTARSTASTVLTLPADDVFPSQAQVDAAQAAVGSATAGVAQAQARYDAANIELLRLQGVVSAATATAAQAEADLAQRTQAADRANLAAAQAQERADAANVAARRDAALLWQGHTSSAGQWALYLEATGPQELADLSSAIDQVSDRRAAVLSDAVSASRIAVEAHRTAGLAQAQQLAATTTARNARDAAQTAADTASARTAVLQQEQSQLVTELARLRGVAASVEQQRQDALAAEAARVAAEAARVAEAARAAAAAAAAANSAGGSDTWTSTPTSGGLSPNEARAAARSMMGSWGFGDEQWGCLDSLWTGESGWRWWARNPSSGAYGIPQSLPATKMAAAGGDWLTNANTQISWGLSYLRDAYGSPCNAWAQWQARSPHWY